MATDNNLKVDELNFNLIKANLKSYLQSQDQFRDYNFDGSGLSVLLDILAYNTYYNSFYLNMVSAEAFLSTAQKRNSVVNLARSLNYTPRSTTAASITGTIAVTTVSGPAQITIPQYTKFSGTVNGTTYTFLTTEAKAISSVSGVYSSSVTLKEGTLITTRYIVDSTDPDQKFIIPNSNVDTTTMTVRVLNSSADNTSRTFTLAENIVEITSSSLVYFLEESNDGTFELKFGDGVIGTALDAGNILVLQYIVTSGTDANDIRSLTYADSITDVGSITFTATDPAAGGADRETTTNIKYNAPKAYESQNRLVTPDDYKALMLRQNNVSSAIVWGGEDNDPPTYGKVYISIKPTFGTVLTASEKNVLINSVIKPKKVLTVQTEIVDPEYIYLIISATVKYDSTQTILSQSQIATIVTNVIKEYNTDEINQFSQYFRYSKLTRLIDTAERSILNSDVSVSMRKETSIQLEQSARYEIAFSNAIDNSTSGRPSSHPFAAGNKVSSNSFTYSGFTDCFLEDNGGLMRIYRVSGLEEISVLANAGTIDYTTGKIILTNFAPSAFADGSVTLKLTAVPQNLDVLPLRNQIISIRDADITVSMLDDRTISLVNR